MHVVSTSMSRRDLNFPTLSAPYRTPCLPPPSPARAATAVAPPRLLDARLPSPPPSAVPLARRACGARVASTCALENPGDHQHARAYPETVAKRPTFLCTRDGTWLFIDASGPSSFSPPPTLFPFQSRQTCRGSTCSARASFSGRNAEITNLAIRLILFHFFRSTGRSILLFSVGKGTDVFFNSEVIVWRDIYIYMYKGYRETGSSGCGIFGFNRETFSSRFSCWLKDWMLLGNSIEIYFNYYFYYSNFSFFKSIHLIVIQRRCTTRHPCLQIETLSRPISDILFEISFLFSAGRVFLVNLSRKRKALRYI